MKRDTSSYASTVSGIALLALCGAVTPANAQVTHQVRPTAVVALGDSFIAGNGGRWLGNSITRSGNRNGTDRAWTGTKYDAHSVYGSSYDNGCYRSDVAEIQSVEIPVDRKINLACSATETGHLLSSEAGGRAFKGEPPQGDQLAEVARDMHIKMIAVSIGGNDLGFGWIIAACMGAFMATPTSHQINCRSAAQHHADKMLPKMRNAVGTVLDDVHRVMTEAGYSQSDYRVILQSAASPFPRGSEFRYPESGFERATVGGCPLWNADADWARDVFSPKFSAELRKIAHSHNVDFLDLQDAFQGREACSKNATLADREGPSSTRSEWVRSAAVLQGDIEETVHPNAYGQRALGRCLTLAYLRGRGEFACTNTEGLGPEGMVVRRITSSPR